MTELDRITELARQLMRRAPDGFIRAECFDAIANRVDGMKPGFADTSDIMDWDACHVQWIGA